MSADGAILTSRHAVQASDVFQRNISLDTEQAFSTTIETVDVWKKQPEQSDSPLA